MPSIFIDANILLGFWCLRDGRLPSELLLPLVELGDHLLVTQQVADEVERNKLTVFLKNMGEMTSRMPPSIPDHLVKHRRYNELNTDLKQIDERAKAARKEWDSVTAELASAISQGSDLASGMLAPLFKKAVAPTEDQLVAARLRQELGNPPGKKGDPLGDQLSWQQFLDAVDKQKTVWVITRDSDLATIVGRSRILDPMLHRELKERGVEKIHVFDNLAAAMKSLKEAGVGAQKIEEEKLIELEKQEAHDARIPFHGLHFPSDGPWTCPACLQRNADRRLTAHPSSYGGWSYWITCSQCGARFDTGEPYDD